MNIINVAVIGTGSIVDAFLSALDQVPGTVCTAILSRRQESALPLAEKYIIPYVYTDLDDLLRNELIDWIYIASPNSLHYEYACRALQQGKHVICEKPVTSNAHELQHLIKLAQDNHLFFFEAITNIHLPNYQWLKENLYRIGQVRFVQCNYSQYSSRYDQLLAGETPNVFNPVFAGGALMDINIYNIHLIMNLFGKPQNIHYTANRHANGIDTSGVVIMQYEDFISEAVGAKDTRSMNFVLIQGEQGYIHVENGANGCRNIRLYTGELEQEYNAQLIDNPLYYELVEFTTMYRQNDYEQCYALLNHSYSVMQVLDQARQDAGIVFPSDRLLQSAFPFSTSS